MNSSSIEAEFNEIEGRNGWMTVYKVIKEKCEKEAKDKHFSLDESKHIDNRKFNRYRDVNPYDHSRIILRRSGDTDYINANLVRCDRANRKYILTQGPLQWTIGHFWLMVWEQNSKAILMLNKLIEKEQIKCHMYWPEQIGDDYILTLKDVALSIELLKSEEFGNFSKRILKLTDLNSKHSREIIQFHYTTWPDFGIPTSPVAFLQFLKQVRDSGALSSTVGPPVVHCSAGIGRSGTFCLVDCCLVLIENEGENKVSVQEILTELRRYRMGLIQTADQLYFSYQAIIEGIKRLNNPNNNDECQNIEPLDIEDEDSGPPPLPPPRSSSRDNKPLPLIPYSESFNEDLNYNTTTSALASESEKEKLNNFINLEKSKHYENIINNIERPLPPLPREASTLGRVDESESDDNNENDIKMVNNVNNNNNNSSNNSDSTNDENDERIVDEDEEKIEENHSDMEDDLEGNEINQFNPNNDLPPIPQDSDNKSNNYVSNGPISLLNDNESPVSSPDSDKSQTTTELRRRKRLERQTAMEEKIREIKRKQKISDEKNSSSPKKRRMPCRETKDDDVEESEDSNK